MYGTRFGNTSWRPYIRSKEDVKLQCGLRGGHLELKVLLCGIRDLVPLAIIVHTIPEDHPDVEVTAKGLTVQVLDVQVEALPCHVVDLMRSNAARVVDIE